MRTRCALMLAGWLATVSLPAWAGPDWTKVAGALGKSGTEMPGGVYRVGLPRADLKVTLDGVALKPALALGSWLAFRTTDDATMVMGDLVLTDTEVSPVMKKLAEGGIEITALHNHLLRAQPATFYMHILGHGDPIQLAAALHDGLVLSKTPLTAPSGAAPPQIELDTALIDRTLGAKREGEWRRLSGEPETRRNGERCRHGRAGRHGFGRSDQLPADGRWQGRDRRGFCPDCQRSQSSAACFARKRHRGHGLAQSHAQ